MKLEEFIRTISDYPQPGIQFKDITPLLLDKAAFAYCIDLLAEQQRNNGFSKIGALDARGFLFGAPLAYALKVPFFPVRKAGKLPYQSIREDYGLEYGKDAVEIHTDAVQKDEKILLVDDVLATGGTMRAACNLVERLGGKVVGCQFVIELSALKGRERLNGYPIHVLLQY